MAKEIKTSSAERSVNGIKMSENEQKRYALLVKTMRTISDENKELHIEIYNKYNDNVENITLVRNWRNWVIER